MNNWKDCYINKIPFIFEFLKISKSIKKILWTKQGLQKFSNFISLLDHEKNSLSISPFKLSLFPIIYFNCLLCGVTLYVV